ncbi:uncharacterized protein aftphb [Halichoeres trimaculatus]|uniref:uncharacterized protein aftphb n=1 Tax=Halichoeres trimaculatus TaxID=147232 RepID=UPI003D9EFCEE
MEPHIVPLHPSSPPLLDDSSSEMGSEDEEFGDFGGFSVGPSCSSDDPPSSLRYSSPSLKPATHQSSSSFNHSVEQSQPTSTVMVDRQGCDSESRMHLTNGYSKRNHSTAATAEGACSPQEETGFADFTIFTGQAAHPWCCGFTPLVGIKEKNSSESLGEKIRESKHEVITESEPRSYSASQAKGNICTVEHCEKRDAALMQPSQDQQQPQEAATAALDFPSEQPHSGEAGLGNPEASNHGCDSLATTGMQEDGGSDEDSKYGEKRISTVPKTFSVCESASDASFCDDLSFDGLSADLEPNVSSLGSPEDQTDWDQTDDEEELENFRHSDSFVIKSDENPRESKTGMSLYLCNQSATQDTSATSQSGTHTDNNFADFRDCGSEHHRDQEYVQIAGAGVQILGNLPPSDSFADFCSAPTQKDGEELWAEFKDPRAVEERKSWTQSQEQVSSLKIDESTEEEGVRQHGRTRGNICQASVSSRVQQLLLSSFPEVKVPSVDGVEQMHSLSALLHDEHLSEIEKEEIPELCRRSQSIQRAMWPHQDLHSAAGLQFQWGGSHSNRTLLRCLGVDIRNIVFIGMEKQPVAVPAFASSLGMLEPTKDSVTAVCSPGHTAVAAQAPPELQVTPEPPTVSGQETLPSSQLDWSSHGLSSSQDDCSALNLDYFGPEKESTSCYSSSSSSRSNSPPPGVDRELYELTISKLETSSTISHMEDTLQRLMSTAEKTTTSVRKPEQDEELSAEASRVISGLPDLSFMRAKVLMFPAVLVPKECCSSKLQ